MPFECEQTLSGANVPLLGSSIGASRKDIAAVEAETRDVLLVSFQDPQTLAFVRRSCPETNGTVIATGGQNTGVLTK